MNRIRTLRNNLLIVAVVFAVLITVVIAAQGSFVASSIAQAGVTREPRPHPMSHVSFPQGIDLLNPRPHPASHLRASGNQP